VASALLRGLAAGAAGTAVISLLGSARQGKPVSEPDRLAGRLGRKILHRRLSGVTRRRSGTLMRWSYGLSLGAMLGLAQRRLRAPLFVAGPGLGLSIWVFELAMLPRVGATPPLRQWSSADIAADAVQAMCFGVAAAATLALIEPTGGR
jgi:hypothetical protein